MNNSIVVSYTFNKEIKEVWNAISIKEELRKWYFDVVDYKFEVGNTFTFYESNETKLYLHKCTFIEIIPQKLIKYSWEHPNQSKGKSIVQWELFEEDKSTKLVLTHTGVENFSDAGEAFSVANFAEGWKAIVTNELRNYLYGVKKLKFEISINSPVEKVWKTMWDKESYTLWTKPFSEGSYYVGELKQGNRVHFLALSGNGMYSDIAFAKENELMVFKHIGMLKNKLELDLDEETKRWTGSYESYKLIDKIGITIVKVEVDVIEDYMEYMQKNFPLALQELKKIAEL